MIFPIRTLGCGFCLIFIQALTCVALVSLELRDLPASASQILGLRVCTRLELEAHIFDPSTLEVIAGV